MSSTAPAEPGPRKAAVLGSPIAHSRSPQLHLAAYRALGLRGWTYDRIECDAEQLPALVAGLGPEWVGLSVTMPGKFAALAFADERTTRAERIGSANTLVRTETGWLADNTDVDGVTGALGSVGPVAGGEAIVLGSGGTAPAAVVALTELGVSRITIGARNPDNAARVVALATEAGVPARFCALDEVALGEAAASASVVVSTLPADVAARYGPVLARVPMLLDAIYDPWPTPLAAAVAAAGGTVISGLQMLLHQAFTQVELFTGRPAPRAAMTCEIGDPA
ncbi:shikimate dehydrogenase [Mycolicibacter terrae]|uniref:Shikimate dehydrogenase n=1 Tax=Mycolicibacter terrae TaxID=1788 RepID=A0AAD1MHT7_9MYCO|nr:shikimate dehydrogenase [Mycolicibacter terrae]ORW91487.1 shikimate dehydrogenase [Mycolicibacter terrae]BBX22364.1 shikimate dehydrogenase [Mycolicibacter terrae]SNV76072.1 shikimate 5-dehydrogenase AroE [Mycolicibacter terrae]